MYYLVLFIKYYYTHANTHLIQIEVAQVSINRWIDKTTMGYLPIEFYSAVKKKKILPFATMWMDLENIMLTEISQSEKDKYHTISLMCGI